jgi:hypothetical protein
VNETRDVATTTASDAAATAVHEVNNVQIEGAADVAGSAASSASQDGLNVAGNAQGAGSGAANSGLVQKPPLAGDTKAPVSNATEQASEPATSAEAAKPSRPLDVTGDANGSASASRESGVAAQGGGSAKAGKN